MMNVETMEALDGHGLMIYQKKDGFRFGIDAVLLAHFADFKDKGIILDLGSGTGVIPLLLQRRFTHAKFLALEIQKPLVEMIQRSIFINHLEEKLEVREGNMVATGLRPSSIDGITCNPPYYATSQKLQSPNEMKAISRHELLMDFDGLCKEAGRILKPNGSFFLIHRPHRLVELLETLRKYKLEPKVIRFIHPEKEKPANLVLIKAVRGAGAEMKIEKPLVVYEDGTYTQELLAIYDALDIERNNR